MLTKPLEEFQRDVIAWFDCGRSKDAVVSLGDGYLGRGWYVWCGTYPDEGSEYISAAKPGWTLKRHKGRWCWVREAA